jgi:hypothetical protein
VGPELPYLKKDMFTGLPFPMSYCVVACDIAGIKAGVVGTLEFATMTVAGLKVS